MSPAMDVSRIMKGSKNTRKLSRPDCDHGADNNYDWYEVRQHQPCELFILQDVDGIFKTYLTSQGFCLRSMDDFITAEDYTLICKTWLRRYIKDLHL